jgi:transcription termination factor NusB
VSRNPRRVAFDAIRAVTADDAYANIVLPGLIDAGGLEGRDARLATELTYGTLRALGTLDAVIAAASGRDTADLDPDLVDALCLGAYQLLYTRIPTHAAVSTTVSLVKAAVNPRVSGLANAVLRKIAARDLDAWADRLATGDEREDLALRHAHPGGVEDRQHDRLRHDPCRGQAHGVGMEATPPGVVSAGGREQGHRSRQRHERKLRRARVDRDPVGGAVGDAVRGGEQPGHDQRRAGQRQQSRCQGGQPLELHAVAQRHRQGHHRDGAQQEHRGHQRAVGADAELAEEAAAPVHVGPQGVQQRRENHGQPARCHRDVRAHQDPPALPTTRGVRLCPHRDFLQLPPTAASVPLRSRSCRVRNAPRVGSAPVPAP